MTSSRSQKTVPAMGAWIVWSEEDRTKGMVSRRFVRKGDRANFRLGYMGGGVKKNRNTKMVCAAEKGKVKYRLHRAPRSCAEDEGGPLGVGLQELISNHLKLLWSKAMVV
jgi:hypothetical protein